MLHTFSRSSDTWQRDTVIAFAERHLGVAADELTLELAPLGGGLEAAVCRATVGFRDSRGRGRHARFVVKRLVGDQRREGQVYQQLAALADQAPTPRFLALEALDEQTTYLYLDEVRPHRRWPWGQTAMSTLILDQLARVHDVAPREHLATSVASWDYEAELAASAASTVDVCASTLYHENLAHLRYHLPQLRRVADSVISMRRQVMADTGVAFVHGDAHPGNAVIERRRGVESALLLDWGRARLGSPLEDVGCWLQTLGMWAPEVRRRHDTLLRHYLAATGRVARLTTHLRESYWLASATNVLSGALRYHAAVAACDGVRPLLVAQSAGAVADCLRVLRRADTCWRA